MVDIKYNFPEYYNLQSGYKVNNLAVDFKDSETKNISEEFITPDDPEFPIKLDNVLARHNILSPQIFGSDNLILEPVRNKLLEIYQSIHKRFISFFPQANVVDVVLAGSICSYIYNDDSDMDIFIVIDKIAADNKELTERFIGALNIFLSLAYFRPTIYQYQVDVGVLLPSADQLRGKNKYSLLNNRWIESPTIGDFPFSKEELRAVYIREYNKIMQYLSKFKKNDNGLFAKDDAKKISDYLLNIRNKAFDAKEYFKAHEYSLDYNVYRLLKHCYVYGYHRMLAAKSLNQV